MSEKCLAALDTTSEVHGRLNYEIMRKTMNEINIDCNRLLALSVRHTETFHAMQVSFNSIISSINSTEAFLKEKSNGLHSQEHFENIL